MIGHVTMPWARARRIAAGAAAVRPTVLLSLPEAVGLVLAEPARALTALPAFDSAEHSGWAVSGPGPWLVEPAGGQRLPDGAAVAVAAQGALPGGADGVVATADAVLEPGRDGTWVYVGDAATGQRAPRPGHLHPGQGIRTQGCWAAPGATLAPAGSYVTPAIIAVAAASGLDALAVVRPPDVVPVTVGDDRRDRGPARGGVPRDPVSLALPGAITRSGARCLPPQLVRGTPGQLRTLVSAVLGDLAADLVLVTGAPGPDARGDVAGALADLGARLLLADIEMTPGSDALLAELADGRLVAYLPGDAPDALTALVTIALPLLRAMAGAPEPDPVLALLDTDLPGSPRATTLVAARHHRGELTDTAQVVPGSALLALGSAQVLVVVPPGGAHAGQLVELVALP